MTKIKKTKNTTKSRNLKKKNNSNEISNSPSQSDAPPIYGGPEKIKTRLVYLRLKNGDEIITMITTLKEHLDEFKEDVVVNEKNFKIKKEILKSVKEEEDTIKKSIPHLTSKTGEDVLLLYYPARLFYLNSPTRGPSLTLTPWISTSITTKQMFRINSSEVLSVSEVEDDLKRYYYAVMQKMMYFTTLAIHRKALADIDPTSEMGKMIAGLKNEYSHNKEAEDQEDEYVAEMIAKSRKPLIEAESNGDIPSTVTNAKESNTLPSIIFSGTKRTLH